MTGQIGLGRDRRRGRAGFVDCLLCGLFEFSAVIEDRGFVGIGVPGGCTGDEWHQLIAGQCVAELAVEVVRVGFFAVEVCA